MKIVLATGIFPPEIGGPATYTKSLASELTSAGHDVTVITYGHPSATHQWHFPVHFVSRSGGPLLRWWRYKNALTEYASDADVVYAFSSVSCGVPLWLAALRKPKKILRLGGDFLWERYTDFGGQKSLRAFYETRQWRVLQWVMQKLLSTFDHIIFSTAFQQEIYQKVYTLPHQSVLENARTFTQPNTPLTPRHRSNNVVRYLFLGRFVGFKNLSNLIDAVAQVPSAVLTLVGDGPLKYPLQNQVQRLGLEQKVLFAAPVSGPEHYELLMHHDVLILPSLTEISPNTALEAAATGLPVLLTQEHGLSIQLVSGMTVQKLQTVSDIANALKEGIPESSASQYDERSWKQVADEHVQFFSSLL